MLTEKQVLLVETLNNITEEKLNCNVWFDNSPSHTPYTHAHMYIDLLKIIFAEILLTTC